MKNTNSSFDERMKKARGKAKERRKFNMLRKKSDPAPKPPEFVPYGTMFKFESRPRPAMLGDSKSRKLQCVSCGELLEWRIYSIAPDKFDDKCPICHVYAHSFWKGKLHQELDPDA